MNTNLNPNINLIEPNYISGLTQADGSFFCTTAKREKADGSLYLVFRPTFEITLDYDSKSTLEEIQKYFNCGMIVKPSGGRFVSAFKVSNLEDIKAIIIPHFLKYPVLFDKLHAFNIFVEITDLLLEIRKNKKVYTEKQINLINIQILNLAVSMNKSSLRSDAAISDLFSILGVKKSEIPSIISNNINKLTSPVTPEFISGYIDGDASFYCVFNVNGQIKPYFNMCFDDGSLEFIEEARIQFKNVKKTIDFSDTLENKGIGSISKHTSISRLIVGSLRELVEYIIPFIEFSPSRNLHTERAEHYSKWKQVVSILSNDPTLSGEEGKQNFLKIVELAYNMNKDGKRRQFTKDEYIQLILSTKYKDTV